MVEQTQAIWSIDLDGNAVGDLDILCREAATEISTNPVTWYVGASFD